MATKIRIEKNVPLPQRYILPPFPLTEMKVGDSFMIEASSRSEKSAIRQKLHRFQVRNPPQKFSVRTIDDKKVRVFRVQ